ncbi:MAG: histidine kinase [Bacteroidota bacterium]
MKQSDKKLYFWTAVIFAIVAVARALQHYFVVDVYQPVQFGLWWHIPFNLFLWWSWLLFIPFIRREIVSPRAAGTPVLHWLFAYFILPSLIIIIRQIVGALIIATVLSGYSDFETQIVKRILGNQWLWLDIAAYFAIVAAVRILEYREKTEESSVKVIEISRQLMQSQLAALESQLHPHFLFNTLNTLSTMIVKKENAEASRMLTLLQKYLHATVFDAAKHDVSLRDEIGFISDYLEIEQVRFGDRMEVRKEIDHETFDALVPQFILQPIVENAIYHAIAPQTSKGILRIAAQKEREGLSIVIEDNGKGMRGEQTKKRQGGIGIRITEERLKRIYGRNASLQFSSSSLGGLRVVFHVPFSSSARSGAEA